MPYGIGTFAVRIRTLLREHAGLPLSDDLIRTGLRSLPIYRKGSCGRTGSAPPLLLLVVLPTLKNQTRRDCSFHIYKPRRSESVTKSNPAPFNKIHP